MNAALMNAVPGKPQIETPRPWWVEAWGAARARAAGTRVEDQHINNEQAAPALAVAARPTPGSDVVATVFRPTYQGGRVVVMPKRKESPRVQRYIADGYRHGVNKGPNELINGVPFRTMDMKQVPRHPVFDRPIRVVTPRERLYQ